ncbi:MAG: cobalt ECF transporter T component CbiQ [Chloroflexi bacterium]|nr:cobalt ECF transporter T component CbiQ [Chloroflexota bacterium]
MSLKIDTYTHLGSPLHRAETRAKIIVFMAVIFAFALVRDLALVPFMLAVTAATYAVSRLPLRYLIGRLRYPGMFVLVLAIFLPLFAGQTVLVQIGPLAVREEGLILMLVTVGRFISIVTMALILLGTTPLLELIDALRRLGVPALLADMTLLTFRYLFEISDALLRMRRAMRLRGFELTRLDGHTLRRMTALIGSILIRSYEQADRVYKAMRLRGYGARPTDEAVGTGAAGVESMTAVQANGAGQAAVAFAEVEFAYPDGHVVLSGVDFRVARGERVGLIGPNGAGKTSLFMLLCGIHTPSAGSITLFGETVKPGGFRPEIGLVFQNPDDQLFSPTVADDIAFGPQNMKLPPDEIARRVEEALALTGTSDLRDRPPHHLSGGEKRMVSIASVLAMRPELMIYDEPDANLDIRARRRLIRFLQDGQQTLIMASHDLEMVIEVCDRVLLLDEGQIVADGPPRTIMGDAAVMEAHGLEIPHSLIPHHHLGSAGQQVAKPHNA